MDTTCFNSEIDESVATTSKMEDSTSTWNKKNSTENCLYCGEFLDPKGIVYNVNTFSTYLWCNKCDKRNYFGKIRQNPKPLPTPPVIKPLARYGLRQKKIPDYQMLEDSSFSDETNDESTDSNDSSPSSSNENPLSNRLTSEEISRMMCEEAQAKRQEKMKNLKE